MTAPAPQSQEWVISDKDYHIALEYFHLEARPYTQTHLSSDDRGWEQGFADGQASAITDCNVCKMNYAATIRNATLDEHPVLQCRKEVQEFACLMESKLKKNDHKSHWSKCNQEYLLTRLDEEVEELHKCFFFYSPGDMNFFMDGQHEDKIPGEAADVANFAMMLWDNFGDKDALRTLRKEAQQR